MCIDIYEYILKCMYRYTGIYIEQVTGVPTESDPAPIW